MCVKSLGISLEFLIKVPTAGTGMALVCIDKISSRIKGHVYDYKYTFNEELRCASESTNKYSSNAIVVKPEGEENVKRMKKEKEKKTKMKKLRDKIVGHIPEALVEVLFTLIYLMKATITGMHMDAPDGKWMLLMGNGWSWWEMDDPDGKWMILMGNGWSWWEIDDPDGKLMPGGVEEIPCIYSYGAKIHKRYIITY